MKTAKIVDPTLTPLVSALTGTTPPAEVSAVHALASARAYINAAREAAGMPAFPKDATNETSDGTATAEAKGKKKPSTSTMLVALTLRGMTGGRKTVALTNEQSLGMVVSGGTMVVKPKAGPMIIIGPDGWDKAVRVDLPVPFLEYEKTRRFVVTLNTNETEIVFGRTMQFRGDSAIICDHAMSTFVIYNMRGVRSIERHELSAPEVKIAK
jgi:hypothetical protein